MSMSAGTSIPRRARSTAAGQQRAERYLHDLGGSLLTGVQVHASRSLTVADVRVQAQAERLVPVLIPLTITQEVRGPAEWFESDQGPGGPQS